MEDRGRNSRTYNNRKKTSARPSGRPASQSRNRRTSGQTPGRRPTGRRSSADRARMRRRRQRNRMIQLVLLIILVIAAIAGIVIWKRYSPSKEQYDMKKYYGIEKDGQLGITVDNKVVEAKGKLSDGKAYVAYDVVRDYINSRFYWDSNENVLLYMLPKDMISVDVGSKDYSVSREKKSEDYVILKTEGNTAYIALDFVQQYTNIDYEMSSNPDHVMIRTKWGKTDVATVKKNTQVRYQGGVKSPVLAELKKKDEVTIIESEENWKKIRTKEGVIGYVKNNTLKNEEKKNITRKFDEQNYSSISKDYTINMAWHNVTNQDANKGVAQKIAQTKGLTTLAPTWVHVADTSGNITSIASSDYVSYAHQQNIEVWMTVRDFDGGISSEQESYELLSYTSRRETLITQLIAEALRVGVDGINVDFEKISDKCGEHYIEFIRELSVKCRQNGLVLSVDNYVPKSFNTQYDRKEQGIVADYVVIMGYDEYYAGSPEAGPVSSYNYVKEGIEETLKEVPAKKKKDKKKIDEKQIEEQIETAKKMPKDEKKKIYKKVFANIILGIVVTLYFIGIGIGFLNIDGPTFITDLKVFSLLILAIAIILFEFAYGKDDDKTALYGVEMLFVAIMSLVLLYTCILHKDKFIAVANIVACIGVLYYLVKSISIYIREKLKWKKTISDVKEIVAEE